MRPRTAWRNSSIFMAPRTVLNAAPCARQLQCKWPIQSAVEVSGARLVVEERLLMMNVLLGLSPVLSVACEVKGQLPLVANCQQVDRSVDDCVKHQVVLEHIFPDRVALWRQLE